MASRGRSPRPGESVPHRFSAWARRLKRASCSRSSRGDRLGQATIFVDADGVHPSEADSCHQHLGEHLDQRANRLRRVACRAAPPAPFAPIEPARQTRTPAAPQQRSRQRRSVPSAQRSGPHAPRRQRTLGARDRRREPPPRPRPPRCNQRLLLLL